MNLLLEFSSSTSRGQKFRISKMTTSARSEVLRKGIVERANRNPSRQPSLRHDLGPFSDIQQRR
jgi:hypothetical protein